MTVVELVFLLGEGLDLKSTGTLELNTQRLPEVLKLKAVLNAEKERTYCGMKAARVPWDISGDFIPFPNVWMKLGSRLL